MRRLLLPSLLTLALAAPAAGAQEALGRLTGFVWDSTTGETLAGAQVVLWGTSHQARTNEAGTFRFEDLPPGSYSVVFFHSRLAHLGISSGSQTVAVGAEEGEPIVLSTPSMTTIMANLCLLDTGDPGSAGATGQIVDASAGVGMPRARVTLRWMDDNRPRELPVEADAEGWFRACDLPRAVPISAVASFLGMASPRREFELGASEMHRVDFALGSLDESDVVGTVRDLDTEVGIEGAEVRLRGTDHFTVTNEFGDFSFHDVDPGEYTLQVDHIAHASRTEVINVGSGVGVRLGIIMAEDAIELDPVVVDIEARTTAERFATGGQLITAEELEPIKERVNTLMDLLFQTTIPGLVVRRAETDVCIHFGSGQVRFMKSGCESAAFYLDGARQVDAQVLMNLPDDIIDRIVVYRPVEAGALFGTGGSRGVIMIYTKGGVPRSLRR